MNSQGRPALVKKQVSDRAGQWRQKAHEQIREGAGALLLPSGMKILARRPGLAFFIEHTRLPLGLAAAAAGGGVPGAGTAPEAVSAATFMRDMLLFCVVDPVISLQPKDGEIHPREIPEADLKFILAWAMRGEEAAGLESFRAKPHDGGAGGDGEEVPSASVEPPVDTRRGVELRVRPVRNSGSPTAGQRTRR